MYVLVHNKLKNSNQRMTRGDGLFHEGSPRAEKIEKEESNAALEQSLKIAFITSLGSV